MFLLREVSRYLGSYAFFMCNIVGIVRCRFGGVLLGGFVGFVGLEVYEIVFYIIRT